MPVSNAEQIDRVLATLEVKVCPKVGGVIEINPILTHSDAKCATVKSAIEKSSLALKGPVMGTHCGWGAVKVSLRMGRVSQGLKMMEEKSRTTLVSGLYNVLRRSPHVCVGEGEEGEFYGPC